MVGSLMIQSASPFGPAMYLRGGHVDVATAKAIGDGRIATLI
jgi:hypothetical protein